MRIDLAGISIVIIMYLLLFFLVIRPYCKRLRNCRKMMNSLHVGNSVSTFSKLHGTVEHVDRVNHVIILDCHGISLQINARDIRSISN